MQNLIQNLEPQYTSYLALMGELWDAFCEDLE